MKKLFILSILIQLSQYSIAQQFISKGMIEYEVKTNVKKTMSGSSWGEMMKDKLPNYKTAYYTYTFSNNKSLYKFDHWENKDLLPEFFRQSDEKSVWYVDFGNAHYNMQKDVFGSAFNVSDSLGKIKWKLSNENKIIAGFNCRKATGIILDSIYVFAFYTDEITIPGGPCTINGLPGTILGMTIPRMYTSWMATKIIKNENQPDIIEPSSTKNVFTTNKAYTTIIEKTKGWMTDSDADSRKWLDQLIWNVLL